MNVFRMFLLNVSLVLMLFVGITKPINYELLAISAGAGIGGIGSVIADNNDHVAKIGVGAGKSLAKMNMYVGTMNYLNEKKPAGTLKFGITDLVSRGLIAAIDGQCDVSGKVNKYYNSMEDGNTKNILALGIKVSPILKEIALIFVAYHVTNFSLPISSEPDDASFILDDRDNMASYSPGHSVLADVNKS